jgi:hypothetical protein
LFQHFLATAKEQSAHNLGPFIHLFIDALHSKDVQIYFDDVGAEAILRDLHIASTIDAPATGDSLMVVDANIIANKSNYFIKYNLSDKVTIDASGAATHHTVVTYDWPNDPGTITNNYGHIKDSNYQYQRVYVSPNAQLKKRTGSDLQNPTFAFNRQVWPSFVHIYYGRVTTLTFDYTTPGAATQDATGWHYNYLLQKQAGVLFNYDLSVTLPSCANVTSSSPTGMFTPADKGLAAKGSLSTDLKMAINYTC